MADNSQNLAYPLQFDPSQWANPYTAYNKMALPFMGRYAGTPTDAHGNPIQSYVNAQAANAAAPPPQAAPVTLNTSPQISSAFSPDQAARILQGTGQWGINSTGGQGGGGVNNQNALDRQASLSAGYQPQAAQPAAPAAAPGGGGAIDMNAAYLAALANPGHVSTLGATVPQSAPPSNQSGVLQQFLQNWQNKGSPTTGAGNYNNQGFFNALQGQV